MIAATNLTKDYLLADRPFDFIKPARGSGVPSFRALDNISFRVAKGEVIGIIGANGAGKSTLLKVLSGIYMPTSGRVEVNGPSTAILELSTGFQPELSGRENIRRRLLLQGLSSSEIKRLEPEIIDFAELDDVIDQQTRTYSTGMGARLAFSIVTSSPAEVLFIDEILAVGDEHFQGKCMKRIKRICASGRTVVMVSHGLSYVEGLCDRAIWLDGGKIRMTGDAHSVVVAYYGQDLAQAETLYPKEFGCIEKVDIQVADDMYELVMFVNRYKTADDLHIQVAMHDNQSGILAGLYNTAFDNSGIPSGKGVVKVTMRVPAFGGLSKGLIGVVLTRGRGTLPGSVIEDGWGWDNGKQLYFNSQHAMAGEAFLNLPLRWSACS